MTDVDSSEIVFDQTQRAVGGQPLAAVVPDDLQGFGPRGVNPPHAVLRAGQPEPSGVVEGKTLDRGVRSFTARGEECETSVAVPHQIAVIIKARPKRSLAIFREARHMKTYARRIARPGQFSRVIAQQLSAMIPLQHATVVHRADPNVAARVFIKAKN